MKKAAYVLAVIFLLAGAGLIYGSNYAKDTVKTQLAAQKIVFPPAEVLEKDNPALVPYAGETVDTGAEAKAYSDYIAGHLQKVAGGKTYSEVSAEFQKNKEDQTLAAQRTTLFMGETLRGLLLNAWGWGLIGAIAMYAGVGLLAAAVLALVVANLSGMQSVKVSTKKGSTKRK